MSCLKSCGGDTIKVVKSRDNVVTGAVKIPTENREAFILPLELMSNACLCKRQMTVGTFQVHWGIPVTCSTKITSSCFPAFDRAAKCLHTTSTFTSDNVISAWKLILCLGKQLTSECIILFLLLVVGLRDFFFVSHCKTNFACTKASPKHEGEGKPDLSSPKCSSPSLQL